MRAWVDGMRTDELLSQERQAWAELARALAMPPEVQVYRLERLAGLDLRTASKRVASARTFPTETPGS